MLYVAYGSLETFVICLPVICLWLTNWSAKNCLEILFSFSVISKVSCHFIVNSYKHKLFAILFNIIQVIRQLGITLCPEFQPVNFVNQFITVLFWLFCHIVMQGGESNKYLEGEGHYPSHVVSDYKRLLSGCVFGSKRHCFLLILACYGVCPCVCYVYACLWRGMQLVFVKRLSLDGGKVSKNINTKMSRSIEIQYLFHFSCFLGNNAYICL